ncbi:MAG: DUF2203 domain-containing protein [Acidobacteriaceae bacterium]
MRTFTLQEAQTLLPVLEALLKRAIVAKEKVEAFEQQLQELQQRILVAGGMIVDVSTVARQRAERDVALKEAQDTLAEMDAIGVQVKDLNTGLLDFPCQLEDQVVLLCWKSGETEITHWHTMESGFQGRQPIDDRFRRSRRERPN